MAVMVTILETFGPLSLYVGQFMFAKLSKLG